MVKTRKAFFSERWEATEAEENRTTLAGGWASLRMRGGLRSPWRGVVPRRSKGLGEGLKGAQGRLKGRLKGNLSGKLNYRGGFPQNGSEIPAFSVSKKIRFGATLCNGYVNFSPAFAGLRFGKPSKQSCNQGNLQNLRNLPQIENCTKPATMHAKTSKSAQNGGNAAETLGQPSETPENLQETFGNLGKPVESLRKPKETPILTLWKLKIFNEGQRQK